MLTTGQIEAAGYVLAVATGLEQDFATMRAQFLLEHRPRRVVSSIPSEPRRVHYILRAGEMTALCGLQPVRVLEGYEYPGTRTCHICQVVAYATERARWNNW